MNKPQAPARPLAPPASLSASGKVLATSKAIGPTGG